MNNKREEMTDMEKSKIDILRDALKDASDTVRALDRKINFLVSYNAVFLGVISTIFFKFNDLKLLIDNYIVFYCILGLLSVIWVFLFIRMMMGIAPKSNPNGVFAENVDKEFSDNTFFVFTDGKSSSLKLNDLVDRYEKINSFIKLEKLLYKEIGKVSYIRDMKLKSVSKSVANSWRLTVLFVLSIVFFSLVSIKFDMNKEINIQTNQDIYTLQFNMFVTPLNKDENDTK